MWTFIVIIIIRRRRKGLFVGVGHVDVQCCSTESTETARTITDVHPGRSPRLSDSSRALRGAFSYKTFYPVFLLPS